jgi:hypothetical protein
LELGLAIFAGSPLLDNFYSLLNFAALAHSDRWWWDLWSGLVDSALFKHTDITGFGYAEVLRHVGDFEGIALAVLCAEGI